MSKREASLQLYNALSGEPEQELEHAPLESINSAQGITYILDQLRGPMSQRLVYQKRKYLSDFENINRYPNEHLRAFVNRYRRTERNLSAVDISVSAMYDSEARGSRLLDRSRLSPQDQRLVLVGSRYSLTFEDISESLAMQFPDFKPPPPVMGRDGQMITRAKGTGKFGNQGQQAPTQDQKHSGGKGGGKPGARKVSVTEAGAEAGEQALDEGDEGGSDNPENNQAADDDHNDDPGDDDGDPDQGDDLDDLAQVLTVTARRLASVRLGRKFSGNKVPPSELKKKTACAACGEVGHWRGDPQCRVSGTGASTATSSSNPGSSTTALAKKGGKGAKPDKPHQAFTVMHSDLGNYEVRSGYGTAFSAEQPEGHYQVRMLCIALALSATWFLTQLASEHVAAAGGFRNIVHSSRFTTSTSSRWTAGIAFSSVRVTPFQLIIEHMFQQFLMTVLPLSLAQESSTLAFRFWQAIHSSRRSAWF